MRKCVEFGSALQEQESKEKESKKLSSLMSLSIIDSPTGPVVLSENVSQISIVRFCRDP